MAVGTANIATLYRNILGRDAAPEEIAAWQGTGLTGQQLFDTFSAAAQSELSARPGVQAVTNPSNNAAMVNANYQSLVGRAPTAEEAAAWQGSGLTGEALYREMAQAAQAEQQATGYQPPKPGPSSNFGQRADTIATFLSPEGSGDAPGPVDKFANQDRTQEFFDAFMKGINTRFDGLESRFDQQNQGGGAAQPSTGASPGNGATAPGTGAGRSTSVRRGSFALGSAPNSRFGGAKAPGFTAGDVSDDGNVSKYTPTSLLSKINP